MIMSAEIIIQEFRLKNINETRNYLTEEVNQNELISKKHKKVNRVLNYIEHLAFFTSTVGRCISAFTWLVSFPTENTSSAVGLKNYLITARTKKYKSIIKRKKEHDKILSLTKSKPNSVDVLILKALIDSNISHNDGVLILFWIMYQKNLMVWKKTAKILMINKSSNHI